MNGIRLLEVPERLKILAKDLLDVVGVLDKDVSFRSEGIAAIRQAVGLVLTKYDFLGHLPYTLAWARNREHAKKCLKQYDESEPSHRPYGSSCKGPICIFSRIRLPHPKLPGRCPGYCSLRALIPKPRRSGQGL